MKQSFNKINFFYLIMIDNEKSLIQSFYESHHEDGQRLKQSFLEKTRGLLFADWIGINKKVLDLGSRDGTLTKYFIEKNKVTCRYL